MRHPQKESLQQRLVLIDAQRGGHHARADASNEWRLWSFGVQRDMARRSVGLEPTDDILWTIELALAAAVAAA